MTDTETSDSSIPIGEPSDQWYEYQGSPTGTDIECEGWRQEAALRLLNNNLDPEVAEDAENLIVYGGSGRPIRSWDAYDVTLTELRDLEDDETLLVQSGKPVGRFTTHEMAPRVLIVTTTLVGKWDNWAHFRELEGKGLMMFGQLTAASWSYIGTQGILQSTYNVLAEVAKNHFGGSLENKIVATAGLGGMGGAQPLAVEMNGGVCIVAEVDSSRINRRRDNGYINTITTDLNEAITRAESVATEGETTSIAVQMNVADMLEEMTERNFIPDVITDQTAAHDEMQGYYPSGYSVEEAEALRKTDPEKYREVSLETMERHVDAMLVLQDRGSIAFEYGNNVRGQVSERFDRDDVFDFPGFIPEYIRPEFCRGYGPFRCIALSGSGEDIEELDAAAADLFPEDEKHQRWLQLVREMDLFQGLPARTFWLGYQSNNGHTQRERMAKKINSLVADGTIQAPIAVTREHEDGGSAAVPNRETEDMKDGSDAVADWPILNALLNCAAGADIVSVNGGAGTGMGTALHASQHVILDGSGLAERKLERVFTTDPGSGIIRHADAGYEVAVEAAKDNNIQVPMRDEF